MLVDAGLCLAFVLGVFYVRWVSFPEVALLQYVARRGWKCNVSVRSCRIVSSNL